MDAINVGGKEPILQKSILDTQYVGAMVNRLLLVTPSDSAVSSFGCLVPPDYDVSAANGASMFVPVSYERAPGGLLRLGMPMDGQLDVDTHHAYAVDGLRYYSAIWVGSSQAFFVSSQQSTLNGADLYSASDLETEQGELFRDFLVLHHFKARNIDFVDFKSFDFKGAVNLADMIKKYKRTHPSISIDTKAVSSVPAISSYGFEF